MNISRIIQKLSNSLLFFICLCFFRCTTVAQSSEEMIRINQIGYYPQADKFAVVMTDKSGSFVIRDFDSGKEVWKGKLGEKRLNPYSEKISRIADFSKFTQNGKFVIEVDDIGKSYPFEIQKNIHADVAKASLKAYYFQRASVNLDSIYASKWSRPAAHLDQKILIHASATSKGRNENDIVASPGGWYDAGDFNKYIVNSGITMGTLLSVYEDFPSYVKTLKVAIPETNNSLPDLLDETLVNLRWMLTMQDPADGGVYHKLTNPFFDGIVMPIQTKQSRYMVQKSTAAALNFTAVMAQSARIFKEYETQLPGLADSCSKAAVASWEWAKRNPQILYDQKAMNQKFKPEIQTGGYEDSELKDEWFWAGAEMCVLKSDVAYLEGIDLALKDPFAIPSWNQVRSLGYYTLLRSAVYHKENPRLYAAIKNKIVHRAEEWVNKLGAQPFQAVMGTDPEHFIWGSNSVAANQGVLLLQAYKYSQNKKILNGALSNLDYILGRNATGYSFLTGFGSKRVMHPHHRVSMADQVLDPIPGLLAGGPNPGQQDKCKTYTSTFADEAFTDDDCSYASNEIAINWNAPLVYLLVGIESLM